MVIIGCFLLSPRGGTGHLSQPQQLDKTILKTYHARLSLPPRIQPLLS
jgi:hypothetical protein